MTLYSDLGTSVKMRMYSLQKRHILVVFICFFVMFFLSVNIGFLGPQILKKKTFRASNLPYQVKDMKSGPFSFNTPLMSKFHQQMWLTAQPIIDGRKEEFSYPFTLNIHLHSDINDKDESVSAKKELQKHSEYFNKTRFLRCHQEICDKFNILHLDYLHAEQYKVDVKFFQLEKLTSLSILDFNFEVNSYNPEFTKLELWFRFSFMTLTFVVLIIYTRSLRKFSLRDWSIEQRWMFILLRSLLLFNNPFFPLNVLVDSWIPHLLDAIFQSSFLAFLMVFWLSIFHGVRESDRDFLTFYVPKFVIVFLILIMSLCLSTWQQYKSLYDPTYNLTMDESNYMIFRVLFVIFFTIYILYLLYLIIRACAELKNMPYYDRRIKISVFLMLVVIGSLVTIAILRLISEPFRQSLFENFTKNYRNTLEFCTIFALFNIYIYTLAFFYSPAKNASLDNDYRENPAFTMLNDTDEEDVIFGSNMQEFQKK